ncbi:MAG: proprotein convertase P-domain-containing protein, partial [Luteibaculum sp.]
MKPILPILLLPCFLFPTLVISQSGQSCPQAISINNLPFSQNNASSCSFTGTGADSYCGSFRPDTEGREIYYTFTPTESTCYNIAVQDWQVDPSDNDFTSDLHVSISEGCPTSAGSTCIMAETINQANLSNLYFEAGKTYFIVFDHNDFNNNCILDLDWTLDRCNIPSCADNPEAADDCVNATPICDLNGYCGSTEDYHNDNQNGINHCGSVENNTWLKFTASATQVMLKAYAFGCENGDGIQMWVGTSAQACNWTGASANGVACEGGSGFGISYNDFNINGLTPGQTYYLMIDGFAGDVCKYVIEAVSGVLPLVDAGEDFTVCTSGASFQLNGTSAAANGWYWTSTGTGSFNNPNILKPNYTPSSSDLAAGFVHLILHHPGDGICNEPDQDTIRVSFIDNQANIAPENPMICLGQSTNLSVSFTNNDVPANGTQNFQNTNQVSIPDDGVSTSWNGTGGNYAASKIDVSCLNPNAWTLTQYCLNITHPWPSDIAGVYLVNACGNRIRLSSNGFTNGCFTPGTTAAWTTFLNCANPNGNWELRVGDDFPSDVGRINSFSLRFNSVNYSWSPATGLSATNVRNPVATPTTTTTYTLQVYDCVSGCVLQDQVTVQVSDIKLAANITQVSCKGKNDGSVTLVPSSFVGPVNYKLGSGGYQANPIFSGLAPGNYTFYARDAAGCEAQVSVTITEPPALVLSTIVAPSDSCVIGSNGTITASSTGGSGSHTYFLNGISQGTTKTYNNLAAGVYEVKVVDGNSCEAIKTVELTEKPIPVLSIVNPNCGETTSLLTVQNNVGNHNLSLSGDAGTNPALTSTANPDEYVLSVSDFGNVQVTLTSSNGNCDSTITQTVVFKRDPNINVTVFDPLCDSLSTNLNINVAPGTFTITVSPSGSAVQLSGNQYRISVPTFGTYDITISANNLGCTKQITRSITFVTPANPNITGPYEVCSTQANIAASPIGGVWSSSAPEISFNDPNNPNTTLTLSGAYGQYPIYYDTPANGTCPAETDSSIVHFYEAPQGSAGNDLQICEGETVSLSGSVIVGQGQWTSGTGIQDVNDLNTPLNLTSAGNFSYELTISNGVCPSITDVVNVKVDKMPIINLPDTLRFCDLSGQLSGHNPVGTILWTSMNPEISFADPGTINTAVTATADGFYKVYLSDKNANCPEVLDSLILYFVAPPMAQATAIDSVCAKTFDLSATLSNPSHFGFWTGTGVFNPNKNSLNPQVTVPTFGTYTYTWTEKGHSACPGDQINLKVEVVKAPNANAGNDINVCGTNTGLSATASTGKGTWSWYAADTASGQLIFGDVHSANSSLQLDTNGVGFGGFGKYYLIWLEENGTVCPSSKDTVLVHFVPSSFPQAGPDQSVCGDSTTLNAIPSYGIGQWSYTGPGSLDFTDIFDFNTAVWLRSSNPVYGVYQLVWTESNSPCTANRDTLNIVFYEPPTFDAGISPDNICGLSYTLAAQKSHGSSKWTWVANDPSDGILSFKNGNDSVVNATVKADKYGSYTLYWSVSYGACAPAPDSVKLNFWEAPTPDATSPADVCASTSNQSIFLTGIASSGTQWTWSGPPGVTFVPDPFQTEVEAQVTAYGTYKFFFAEENHPVCGTVRDSVFVEVLEKPEISAGVDAIACGPSHQLSASIIKGKGEGTWKVDRIIPAGKNISFSNPNDSTGLITIQPAPTIDPDTAYLVWEVKSGVSCPWVYDTVQIVFEPEPQQFFAGEDSTLCDTLSLHLYADQLPSASFQGTWQQISGPGVISFEADDYNKNDVKITASTYGVYKLIWRVNTSSCPNGVVDELILDFREKPQSNAGSDTLVCGLDVLLSAGSIPARAVGQWKHIGGTATIDDPNALSTTARLPNNAYGFHQFVFETSNGSIGLCASPITDTLRVALYEAPGSDAGSEQILCGDSTQLEARISVDTSKSDNYRAFWKLLDGPGTADFSPNSAVNDASVKVSAFGDYLFKWVEENGVCPVDSDLVECSFVTSAQPQAGPDIDTCGLKITVSAIPSFNVGRWTFPTNGVQAIFTNPTAFSTQLSVDEYGTYPVIWEETNSPCPSNQDTIMVSFNEIPNAKPIAPADFCGTSGTALTTASVSESQFQGYWKSNEINLNILQSDSVVTSLELINDDYGLKQLW